LWIFHDKLDLEKFYLRWVPDTLLIKQKIDRVLYLKLLVTALMKEKASNFQGIITGDESRFFFDSPRDSVWAALRDELLQPIKQKIETENCPVSILWSVNGIRSPLDVPKGTTYNTAFFTDAVMLSLTENVRSRTRRKTLKGWLFQMDNARPHNLPRAQRHIEAARAEPLQHPTYDPNLAVSDFLLFRYIKGRLSYYSRESRKDLLNAIVEICTGACQKVLLSVSESW
jgi:hypothetical protein